MKTLLFKCLLLIYLIELIGNITIKLTSLPYKCIGNSMGRFGFLRDLPVSLPTMIICIGTPGDQCFNLGISISRSGIIVETIHKKEYQFDHQYTPNHSSSYNKTNYSTKFHLDSRVVSGSISKDIISFKDINDKQYGGLTAINNKEPLCFDLLSSSQGNNKKQVIDGYIGLFTEFSPMTKKANYEIDFSLINYLYNFTQITKRNVILNYDYDNPLLEFDESYGNYPRCNRSILSKNLYHWVCSPNHISIGDLRMKIDIGDSVTFDSLIGVIIASSESGTFIHERIITLSKGKCSTKNDFDKAILVCDKNTDINFFPDIYLNMLEGSMIFKWENLFNYSNEHDCLFSTFTYKKFPIITKDWIIGIPGLRTNKMIYDYDEMSLGFIPIQNSPYHYSLNTSSSHYIIYIICIVLLLFGIIILSIGKGKIIRL